MAELQMGVVGAHMDPTEYDSLLETCLLIEGHQFSCLY